MALQGTRIAILVEDLYQDQEVWYPYYRLKEAGAEIAVVGTGKPEYKSKFGYPITPTLSAEQASAKDFDAVLVPGGYAPDLLRRFPAVLRLVREAFEQGKVIGAICHAGWVLCSAGILRGRTVTCFSAIKDDVVNAGATYVDREVVRDHNLITSRTPDDLPAFVRTIIGALEERRPAAPFAFGERRPAPVPSRVEGRRAAAGGLQPRPPQQPQPAGAGAAVASGAAPSWPDDAGRPRHRRRRRGGRGRNRNAAKPATESPASP